MSQAPVDTGHTAGVARVQAAMTAVRAGMHEVFLAVAALDADGVAQATGYRSTVRLLQDALRVNRTEATRLLDRAHDLAPRTTLTGQPLPPTRPATAQASAAGTLGEGHLGVVAATLTRLAEIPAMDPEVLDAAEQALVHHARSLAPAGLEKVATRLVEDLDPDGVAPAEPTDPADELHLVRRRDGSGLALSARIHGATDTETFVEVLDALSAPAGPDDTRTLAQRRAEVLKELMAQAISPTGIATDTRHGDAPDRADDEAPEGDAADDDAAEHDAAEHDAAGTGAGRETDTGGAGAGNAAGAAPGAARRCTTVPVAGRALLAVTIDHRWLQRRVGHGLLDSHQPIDPATARRLACDAGIVPMVLGTRSEPLDVGRLSYTVPEGMRRALHHRDRGCSFPGCTRRPRRCHAHHIEHWADGGDTRLDNLALLCVFHHHLVHHGHWTVAMVDGRPWYTPPRWIDPHQRPRPGGRFPTTDTA